MSAEDSEIMSITNSAIESLNKSDSFRSLVGDDFRQFLISPLGGNTFYLKTFEQKSSMQYFYLYFEMSGKLHAKLSCEDDETLKNN